MDNLWQLGNEFRGQAKGSEDHQWSVVSNKLAELTKSKGVRMNNLDYSREKLGFQEDNKLDGFMNLDMKMNDFSLKGSFRNHGYNMNTMYQKNNADSFSNFKMNGGMNAGMNKYSTVSRGKDVNNGVNGNIYNGNNNNSANNNVVDKRFKTLPLTEMLPRNEVLGGYIFVCNNDTFEDDLKRQLFGLPPRYRDSVRAITPGLPLFLYNYTTHKLHGVFEAASFGGTNIDPTAWEDKKCKGESRFPAQVRIRIRKHCKALEEDAFRPVLHHYDGPKFRLELSIAETLSLLDLCEKEGTYV